MFLPQLFLFKRKIDLMAQIKITVPVLIQNVKSDGQLLYLVKPVFFQQPQVSDRSLETALQQFRQQLRKSLSSIQIDRTNFEKLFWYKFNPKIQHKVIPLQFYIGKKQYVAAKFSVISFCLGTEYFITLSGFSSHTFMTGKSELKGKALQDKVITEICQLVKSYKKQYDCELWDMEQHQTARAEFASELELTIEVEHKGFNFEDEKLNLDEIFRNVDLTFDQIKQLKLDSEIGINSLQEKMIDLNGLKVEIEKCNFNETNKFHDEKNFGVLNFEKINVYIY